MGDPDLPFLVGQMSPEGMNSREKQMVNDVHKNLPYRVSNCAFVDATDLQSADPRDVDHFSPDSYRELGERYADAYAHLLHHGPVRGVLSDRIARDNRLKPERGAQRGTLLDDMPEQLRPHRLLGDTSAPSHMELPLPGSSNRADRGNRFMPERGDQRGVLLDEMPDQLRPHRLLGDTSAPSHMELPLPGSSNRADRGNRFMPERGDQRGVLLDEMPDQLRPHRLLGDTSAPSHMELPLPGSSNRTDRGNRFMPERGDQRGVLLDEMPDQLRPHRLLGETSAPSHMELPLPGTSQRRNSDDRIRPELSGFGNSGPLRVDEGPRNLLRGDRTRRGSVLLPMSDSKVPEKESPVHIFILAGGSNMVGFGPVSKSDQEPDPRVVALSKQGEWVPAREPLFSKYGLGPGKAFGERLANHYLKNKKYSKKRTPEERRRHKEKKLRLQRLVEEKQKKLAFVDAEVSKKLSGMCPDINVVLSKGVVELKKKIQFESNRAVVKEESHDLIDQVVFAMKEIDRVIDREGKRLGLQPLKFEIAGHTHTSKAKARSPGTMKLSLGRAQAVMDILVKDGASREHLTCKGYGGTKPRSSRPSKNRRVEIHVVNDEFGIDVSDSDSDEEEEDLILTDDPEVPVRVGLVPCAIAGSKIRDWLSGDRNGQNPMRDTLVNVQDALKAGGVLKGILWHQGEDDCTPQRMHRDTEKILRRWSIRFVRLWVILIFRFWLVR